MITPPFEPVPPRNGNGGDLKPIVFSAGARLGLGVGVVAFLGDGFFALAVETGSEFIHMVGSAWLASSLGLLAVWLGLGGLRLYLRVGIVGVVCAVVACLLRPPELGKFLVGIILTAFAAALPLGILQILGFEFRNVQETAPVAEGSLELRRSQFSLRQLLGWSLTASLVASFAGLAHFSREDLLPWAIFATLFTLIALGTACTVLMPRTGTRVGLLMIPLCAATLAIVDGLIVTLSGRSIVTQEFTFFASVTLLIDVFLMAGVLLSYRFLGYRFVRRRAHSAPVTN